MTESDACGVGLVCQMAGPSAASREIVSDALQMLVKMSHRAGVSEPGTGDGAGILLGTPHDFMLETMVNELRVDPTRLPGPGEYAAGMTFLGRHGDAAAASESRASVTRALTDQGLDVLGWREVPTNPDAGLGRVALETRPWAEMVLVQRPAGMTGAEFETRLYVVRQSLTKDGAAGSGGMPEDFDICSLSPTTLVYKGQLMPELLEKCAVWPHPSACARPTAAPSPGTTRTCRTRCSARMWRSCTRGSAPTPSRRGRGRSRTGCWRTMARSTRSGGT